MNNVFWDHIWVEFDTRLCHVTFNYQCHFPLLSITLTVACQLLLVFCKAKVIQPPCCNASHKGSCSALYKPLCWEF